MLLNTLHIEICSNFAYGLFYAWDANHEIKRICHSPSSVFQNLIWKFSAFEQVSEQMKEL